MPDPSDDSSSDSSSTSDVEMCEAEGDSSAYEEDTEASPKERGQCGQFVWPCPREFPAELEVRRERRWLKPEDMSKADFGVLFKSTLAKFQLGPSIVRLHCFDEPHKRYCKETGQRLRHKHLIFKLKCTFAHRQIEKALERHGVHGRFSFNLVGYVAYLNYVLEPTAKKLASDIDREPWSWPAGLVISELDAIRRAQSNQMAARNGQAAGRGRKRRLLTFSEVTDAFVEAGVKTEKDALELAKKRKVAGDDTLFNTLGAERSVPELVERVLYAWGCKGLSSGTLASAPEYTLPAFIDVEAVSSDVVNWQKGSHQTHVLILFGPGGWGKTEFACGLMHGVAPSGTFHFINKLDRVEDLHFSPGEGLVVDEISLADRHIDDVKGLLDLAKTRDVGCWNKGGAIPMRAPRIITTNWSWETFWPQAMFLKEHRAAIQRRVIWVPVTKDLRRVGNAGAVARDAGDDEEDPFGHSCSLDA